MQLGIIEQELLSLIKLQHPNLVHYLALKHSPGKEAVCVEVSWPALAIHRLSSRYVPPQPLPLALLMPPPTGTLPLQELSTK